MEQPLKGENMSSPCDLVITVASEADLPFPWIMIINYKNEC